MGFSPDNVRVLADYADSDTLTRDGNATRASVLQQLGWAVDGSQAQNKVVVVFLGLSRRQELCSTNQLLPSDWDSAGVVSADAVILLSVLPCHPSAVMTVWLDCNHPQLPINQLQYMFYSLTEPRGTVVVTKVDSSGDVVVVPREFTNTWYLRDDKSTPLPRQVVMYASVLDGATLSQASDNVGKMTDMLLKLLPRSNYALPNRTLVKELHIACVALKRYSFRAVMSMSSRTFFNTWFLRATNPSIFQVHD
jgi:hypothetical protein